MKSKICVFDFDGTLTTCDTLLRFIPFACGRWAFWWGMLLHAPLLVLMKLGLYDNGRAKERVFRYFFRWMKESMFNNLCDSFADANDDILRPEGIKTLRQALAEGHEVVVVSASIDRWVRPFFKSNLAPSHPRTPAPRLHSSLLSPLSSENRRRHPLLLCIKSGLLRLVQALCHRRCVHHCFRLSSCSGH